VCGARNSNCGDVWTVGRACVEQEVITCGDVWTVGRACEEQEVVTLGMFGHSEERVWCKK
jgi:hypothetical protein